MSRKGRIAVLVNELAGYRGLAALITLVAGSLASVLLGRSVAEAARVGGPVFSCSGSDAAGTITYFSTPATVALQRETRTIPIVFAGVGDPVASGIVPRLDRPGGNITGFGLLEPTLKSTHPPP